VIAHRVIAPASKRVGGLELIWTRDCETPEGLHEAIERRAPPNISRDDRDRAAPPKSNVTARLLGDPPAGRSALDAMNRKPKRTA
jgi:hypothetical protein